MDRTYVKEGVCADGKHFLSEPGGFEPTVAYFDGAGAAVAIAAQGDVSLDHCDGGSFAPSLAAVRCDPVEWATLCGEASNSIQLPFGDGTPAGHKTERSAQP
jgi:hypothetical protein